MIGRGGVAKLIKVKVLKIDLPYVERIEYRNFLSKMSVRVFTHLNLLRLLEL